MATTVNFASISGVISVTSGSNPPKYFYGAVGQFCQTPDATGYLIFIGGTSFTVSLSELRINGQAPTSLENAATLLSALFQLTNSSSGGSGVGYPEGTKMYVALLNQTGTDAPVATVLVNTLGGTVVWTRSNNSKFIATLSGAFPSAKTVLPGTNIQNLSDGDLVTVALRRDSDNAVHLTGDSLSSGTNLDGRFDGQGATIIFYVLP